MHITFRSTSCQLFSASLGCLSALALLNAAPAGAQTLRLGTFQSVRPPLSGTATIDAAGTAASGSYTFTAGTGPTTTTYRGVELYNNSVLNFQNGSTITVALFNQGAGTANVYGGSVKNILGYDSSVTNIYGGSTFYATALGSSVGGVPGSGTINIYGGGLTYLAAEQTGVIDIFGSGLTETYLGTSDPFQIYSLTGTLQDGTVLAATYSSDNGTVLFNGQPAVPIPAVPEASTTVSLGLLLMLGLGGMAVAAKRRKSATQV